MVVAEFTLEDVQHVLTLFGTSFSLIGMLGFQSQLVKNKEILPTFFTSCCIGALQLVIYKASPNAGLAESIAYVFGGACGVVSSIYLHNIYLKVTGKEDK